MFGFGAARPSALANQVHGSEGTFGVVAAAHAVKAPSPFAEVAGTIGRICPAQSISRAEAIATTVGINVSSHGLKLRSGSSMWWFV